MASDRWSSRLGFLLATTGAAVGLGNIWRFSAVLGANGGGAYLVPYLLAAFSLAVPMLVLELAVGRTLRSDVVSAFRSVDTAYTALGWLVVGGVLLILSYYLVLTGWVFGFLLSWLGGSGTTFATFTEGWLPVGYFVVATVVTGAVVARGVRGGIERMSKIVMPTVFVLLVALAGYAVTFSGWGRAVEFLFTPDLSVLTDPALWSAAFGQVFFSLSVGQGIMLTYGSYTDEETDLLRSSLVITVSDISAALLAGLVIFPIVFSFGLQPTLGTELAFTTLPTAFASMGFGRVVAVAFFGLLFFAALSSSVSLLEVGVAAATNTTRLGRTRATYLLTAGVFLVGVPSALSYSPLDLTVVGTPVLDLVDESVGTYALPLSAICIALVFGWAADLAPVRAELGRLYPVVRYVVPPVLALVTAAKAAGVARPAWRLLLDGGRDGALALVATGVVLIVLGALGWLLRTRLPYPRRRRR
ncbi:sodium-dependent transporter [Haloplanus aerogenes]|uniref:NSS family neurotransmitter:Na+ symporter n=1 Tax=Haloplanus aerogenes TaxID=660522 RepID=A0A3M0DG25_9EURY|nr:sodium-dependent transporter [Haloplanus aerogenes]AZH26293.1 sodium-dependent transporter [Haloplanus aerogenes]RMB18249.1 NSS family neurotransmitter:Na+ symporter [Haloplanus aerogenes]